MIRDNLFHRQGNPLVAAARAIAYPSMSTRACSVSILGSAYTGVGEEYSVTPPFGSMTIGSLEPSRRATLLIERMDPTGNCGSSEPAARCSASGTLRSAPQKRRKMPPQAQSAQQNLPSGKGVPVGRRPGCPEPPDGLGRFQEALRK